MIEESTAYVTAGIDGKNHLISVDVHSGDVNWSVALVKDRGKKNRKGSGSNPSAVIDEVKLSRRKAALGVGVLAAALGVGIMTVSNWETGRRSAPSYLALALRGLEVGDV